MYNTKIICTYNNKDFFKDFGNIDNMTKKDKEFYQDAYYRYELLNIFGLEEYNENAIDEAMHDLYEKVKECKELKECMLKLAANFMSLDEELGLMFLFAYDYMYLSHICISEFLETGKVSDENIFTLKSLIF
jgi:predicted phosphohydrolase